MIDSLWSRDRDESPRQNELGGGASGDRYMQAILERKFRKLGAIVPGVL
jgi:hypothetical protein